MRNLRNLFAGLLVMIGATPAFAEIRVAQTPIRYLVIPAGPAGEKVVSEGQVAFSFPLRWEQAALLDSALEITADDRTTMIQRGQALVETRLIFDQPGFNEAVAYCTPRTADPMRKAAGLLVFGLVGQALARSATDGQYCLIDRDRDGQADHSVLVNAGSPAARTPRTIPPVRYTVSPEAIVSEGDKVEILYRGGRGSFEMKVIQQGKPRFYQTFTYSDGRGKHRLDRFMRGDKLGGNVVRYAGPGFDFTTSNYDRARSTIKVNWSGIMFPAVIPIPDEVKTTRGY